MKWLGQVGKWIALLAPYAGIVAVYVMLTNH